jgi:hypothetical protein
LRILLGDKAPIRISRETTSERIEYGAGGAGRRVVEERMEEG